MAPAGLRVTQFSLLRTLDASGPLRISDLAARQLLDRTALSRNLDPLVEQGLVDIVCGDDARTREATITRKGKSTLRAATAYWTRAQKEVAARLGRDKLDALIAVLGELESLHPSKRPSPQPSPRDARQGLHPSKRPSPQLSPRDARRGLHPSKRPSPQPSPRDARQGLHPSKRPSPQPSPRDARQGLHPSQRPSPQPSPRDARRRLHPPQRPSPPRRAGRS
jgi:DNA-binding MarR family transcriptional regulator